MPANRLPSGSERFRIDRCAIGLDAPFADRIEILEREAERIHPLMARRARRVLPMKLHPLPQRLRLTVGARFFQRRHIERRRRRRRPEQLANSHRPRITTDVRFG